MAEELGRRGSEFRDELKAGANDSSDLGVDGRREDIAMVFHIVYFGHNVLVPERRSGIVELVKKDSKTPDVDTFCLVKTQKDFRSKIVSSSTKSRSNKSVSYRGGEAEVCNLCDSHRIGQHILQFQISMNEPSFVK